MLEETKGVLEFDWKIGPVKSLYNMTSDCHKISPVVKAETLKGTKWCLSLYRSISTLPGSFTCSLCRLDDDEDKSEKIRFTYKLELIDRCGKILKKAVEENITLARRSTREVDNFLNSNSLNLYGKNTDFFFFYRCVTVRCHITDESYKNQITTQEVPTTIHTQWEINAPGSENWSKKLKVPFHELTDTNIVLQASDERINVKIKKTDLLLLYKFEISVLSDQSCKIDCQWPKKAVENQILETWIEKNQLVDESRFHLPYSFTLVCSVKGNSDSSTANLTLGGSFPRLKAFSLPLQEDLKELLLNIKHSDVKLRTHDKIIAAHKCLLSARSPVFSTMFDQDMSETQTGVVDIPDEESETMQSFLEFLYTDIVTDTDYEQLLKLILVADKYQVDCLKEQCSVVLMSKLSLENACEVVSVSDMVNLPNLKLSAFNFIKENKKKIISSPVWSEWVEKNTKLAVEILTKLIDV